MDILVVGMEVAFQLMLGRLFVAVESFVNYVSEAPQRFIEDVLLCVVVALVFMLRRRYIFEKIKQLANRFAAQLKASCGFMKIRQTQAREVSVSPPEEAKPLKLQTLCLAVLVENMNMFYCLLEEVLKEEENDELLEDSFHRVMMACAEAQKRLLKESSASLQVQGAETENILETSEKKVDMDMPDDLAKMVHPEENIQLLSQEAAKWPEGAQE